MKRIVKKRVVREDQDKHRDSKPQQKVMGMKSIERTRKRIH